MSGEAGAGYWSKHYYLRLSTGEAVSPVAPPGAGPEYQARHWQSLDASYCDRLASCARQVTSLVDRAAVELPLLDLPVDATARPPVTIDWSAPDSRFEWLFADAAGERPTQSWPLQLAVEVEIPNRSGSRFWNPGRLRLSLALPHPVERIRFHTLIDAIIEAVARSRGDSAPPGAALPVVALEPAELVDGPVRCTSPFSRRWVDAAHALLFRERSEAEVRLLMEAVQAALAGAIRAGRTKLRLVPFAQACGNERAGLLRRLALLGRRAKLAEFPLRFGVALGTAQISYRGSRLEAEEALRQALSLLLLDDSARPYVID